MSTSKTHRLSIIRVLIALVILGGLGFAAFRGAEEYQEHRTTDTPQPWFAAYVDVTATPTFAFEQMGATDTKNVVLSFIVADPDEPCTPTWGTAYTMDEAASALDLDRRIARLQQQEGSIAISFGGLLNDELAITCTDVDALKAAYTSVVERYDVDTIDLDIETTNLLDTAAAKRRAQAISELQAERRAKGKQLAVWLTLPVIPQGLTPDGTTAVSLLLDGDVDLAGVNVMTMDYGQAKPEDMNMGDAGISALKETKRQLGILYEQSGVFLNDTTLWSKIGATPMLGQNDVPAEVFSLEDAETLNHFAQEQGVGRMSMWSANRDITCGSNYVNLTIVSDSCSGVDQNQYDFSVALSQGFKGDLSDYADVVTTADAEAEEITDDPAHSPYQIWNENGSYLEGTKVVWHRNVYQAKWWTQGDIPDNPVLQSWETPWELIGPVLPGETPIPQPTLPPGSFPDWNGETTYQADDYVLFEGIPFKAKWWNKGSSPAAATSNASSSPWVALTQKQISELGFATPEPTPEPVRE